jgi:peptidylprolyl isomerase
VVQWGDADGEDKAKAKALPTEVKVVEQPYFETKLTEKFTREFVDSSLRPLVSALDREMVCIEKVQDDCNNEPISYSAGVFRKGDPYAIVVGFAEGWPYAGGYDRRGRNEFWPVHCYGSVGVGRNEPPDTGTGAELYAVIGHAPRQLDRNIAVVGRVIEGMEHLSTLPRGTGDIGFYKTPEERTPIRSIRIGSDVADLPRFEYLNTESASFARYADARANRRDAFYIQPAGGVDICNVPVTVRRVK